MINKLYLLLITLFFSSYFYSIVEEDPLPTLGDYSSASISLSGEYELGRLWLAMYRGSTKEHSDPLMRTYLEDLIQDIKLLKLLHLFHKQLKHFQLCLEYLF